MPSSNSSLSSFSSRLDTVRRRTCDETALTNSSFAIPIDSWFADRDDELALSLVNVFLSAETAIAELTHLHHVPQNASYTFVIARQLNKIKGLTIDSLQARGLHEAVKEISSFEKFGGYLVFESPVAQPEKRPQLDWTCGRLQPGTGCGCLH